MKEQCCSSFLPSLSVSAYCTHAVQMTVHSSGRRKLASVAEVGSLAGATFPQFSWSLGRKEGAEIFYLRLIIDWVVFTKYCEGRLNCLQVLCTAMRVRERMAEQKRWPNFHTWELLCVLLMQHTVYIIRAIGLAHFWQLIVSSVLSRTWYCNHWQSAVENVQNRGLYT